MALRETTLVAPRRPIVATHLVVVSCGSVTEGVLKEVLPDCGHAILAVVEDWKGQRNEARLERRTGDWGDLLTLVAVEHGSNQTPTQF